jgi:uroporphyrinogen III methyltransferase/synthase
MKKTLFTGLDPTFFDVGKSCLHVPLIEIIPRAFENKDIQTMFSQLKDFTHVIFTSKNTVRIFFDYLERKNLSLEDMAHLKIISIGKRTTLELELHHCKNMITSTRESQEGIIELLMTLPLENAYLLLPRSSMARPNLAHYLVEHSIHSFHCDLYDTIYKKPDQKLPFDEVSEIIFTSQK